MKVDAGKNLNARLLLLEIASSFDLLAYQAKDDGQTERAQLVIRRTNSVVAKRQQTIVTRLRQLASEHDKCAPSLAADFNRTADDIEAGRATLKRPTFKRQPSRKPPAL
jgi:hypothetical protein